MKVGVQIPLFAPHASGEGAVALAVETEQLGFDSVRVNACGRLLERFARKALPLLASPP
jgi:hypothetical protein